MGQWNNNGGENGSGQEIGKGGAGAMTVSVNLIVPTPLMQFFVGRLENA